MGTPHEDIGLPKWPEHRVTGKKLTPEQAGSVILRTDSFFSYASGNDKAWVQQLCDLFGVKFDQWHGDWEDLQRVRERIKWVGGEYVHNDRLSSSYIGGPHGFCNWMGTILSTGHNVGKWPSVKAIREDWEKIAAAFPFLDLRAQLFDMESGENEVDAGRERRCLVEFVVKDGTVVLADHGEIIQAAPPDRLDAELLQLFSNPFRERGAPIEVISKAWDRVLEETK